MNLQVIILSEKYVKCQYIFEKGAIQNDMLEKLLAHNLIIQSLAAIKWGSN